MLQKKVEHKHLQVLMDIAYDKSQVEETNKTTPKVILGELEVIWDNIEPIEYPIIYTEEEKKSTVFGDIFMADTYFRFIDEEWSYIENRLKSLEQDSEYLWSSLIKLIDEAKLYVDLHKTIYDKGSKVKNEVSEELFMKLFNIMQKLKVRKNNSIKYVDNIGKWDLEYEGKTEQYYYINLFLSPYGNDVFYAKTLEELINAVDVIFTNQPEDYDYSKASWEIHYYFEVVDEQGNYIDNLEIPKIINKNVDVEKFWEKTYKG